MALYASQTVKLELPPDQKEAMAIARRRQQEEERKARIFNAKARTLGRDQAALEQQIALKREQLEREKQRDAMYDQLQMETLRQLNALEAEQERQRRAMAQDVEDFRATCQTKDQRREWDLNDPEAKRKDLPARVSDDDPRLGASSLQKFDGEDLEQRTRKGAQATQLKNWFQQQVKEKTLRTQAEIDMDRLAAAREAEINARIAEMEDEQARLRAEMARATAEHNRNLAEARKQAEKQRYHEDQEDNLQEVVNQLDSDLLTENRGTTVHAFNPHRVVPYHFKGMSPAQQQAILDEQARQRQELQERREREKREEEAWAELQARQLRELTLREREIERARAALKQQVAEEHKQQAAEQRARQQFLNRELYANEVRPEYFDQFNTSSR